MLSLMWLFTVAAWHWWWLSGGVVSVEVRHTSFGQELHTSVGQGDVSSDLSSIYVPQKFHPTSGE